MDYPWLSPVAEKLLAREHSLHHALLFCAQPDAGGRQFVEGLAARLLCQQALGTQACGRCAACRWLEQGNHPALIYLVPENDADEGAGDSDKDKKLSSQIRIEQIRGLQEVLSIGGSHQQRRIVIVDPLEAMNVSTANAFLKLLEEPPPGTQFLMLSYQYGSLLPTVLSRCQRWTLPKPSLAVAQHWLAQQQASGMDALLALADGDPVVALTLRSLGLDEYLQRFVRDLFELKQGDMVRLAGQWESWLKSKPAQASRFDLYRLTDWLRAWTADLVVLLMGGEPRYFPAQTELMRKQVAGISPIAVSVLYERMEQVLRRSRHPLNLRLFLEDMLIHYQLGLRGIDVRQIIL